MRKIMGLGTTKALIPENAGGGGLCSKTTRLGVLFLLCIYLIWITFTNHHRARLFIQTTTRGVAAVWSGSRK